MPAADALLQRFRGRSVLVIGDVMLDQFVIGRVDRISPEAPVPIVHFEHDEYRLGGAANVANNVVALEGRAEMIGIVGSDRDAEHLRSELARRGIGAAGLETDPSRCTTRKLRIVTTRNQQVARVDYESDGEVEGALEQALVRSIHQLAGSADVILVSDYLKGVVSREVAAAAVAAGTRRGIPVLIDPKVPHIDFYRGATLVTPNHHEAESVTHMRIRSSAEACEAARRFRQRAGCASVVITRGEHGMWILGEEREMELPAEAREVSDVTGAGDTVIGTLALGLAAGGPLEDAARLANRAAAIVVGRFGPATVSVAELAGSAPRAELTTGRIDS